MNSKEMLSKALEKSICSMIPGQGVGVEKILKKRVGDRVTLGGCVQAEAFKGLVVQVNLNAGCSAWV